MINCLALTLTIEDAFQNLKNLENLAKEDLGKGDLKISYQFYECVITVSEKDRSQRRILKNLIDDLRQKGTLRKD